MAMILRPAVGVVAALLVWRWLAGMLAMAVVEPSNRLGLAFAALLPGVLVLNLMIVTQMLLRIRARALDPLAGRDDSRLLANQRVISNTVEQLAGFAPSLLAVAAAGPPGRMVWVIAAGLVFALARLTFWAGYLMHPLWRAPGMAATLTVGLGTFAAAVFVWWP